MALRIELLTIGKGGKMSTEQTSINKINIYYF